ncbi:MAG: hypothetical protein K2K03_01580 [Prevotella sp.]|nr:hypothetical protein [Prevotella sp.]
MTQAFRYIMTFCLLTMGVAVKAQTSLEGQKDMPRDSTINREFQEWLLNEPKQNLEHDSVSHVSPLPSETAIVSPQRLMPKHPGISPDLKIITPAVRQDMRLAYQSHWLEEQRKSQQAGAMMIGVDPIALVARIVLSLLPKRKSKKERQREQLQQVLDNY